MIEQRRRVTSVYVILVVFTFVAVAFATGFAHEILSARGAAAGAAVLAFIKARFVALDFMELGGTSAQRYVDLWLAIIGAACLILILR
ncbi:cytochrome C oxidase subunit IV family protein [Mycolicibacterium austroafricanum]|uniref:cytochrome C oxidase subunit IV family protein n=1 Tax=Mycolicibacterium austroafricanum TaxID=39687 RepID=UPI001CA329AE|nr:cytochrome C oxidase subunit IV family protein [Mycolicibacterium austroafricanum]QZT59573.1 cytochrome C oxidase subunit IV family protein [Mycolicibacterium austroafricanum]